MQMGRQYGATWRFYQITFEGYSGALFTTVLTPMIADLKPFATFYLSVPRHTVVVSNIKLEVSLAGYSMTIAAYCTVLCCVTALYCRYPVAVVGKSSSDTDGELILTMAPPKESPPCAFILDVSVILSSIHILDCVYCISCEYSSTKLYILSKLLSPR